MPGKWEYTQVDNRHASSRNKGVCHTVALPCTLKSILRQKKKNYGKLKYFTMQKLYQIVKKKTL
jgi:hypothetical protein